MMKKRLNSLSRFLLTKGIWIIHAVQAAIICIAVAIAWLLRFDFQWSYTNLLFESGPWLVVIRIVTMRMFGLHRGWWRYTGVSDVLDVVKAVGTGSLIFIPLNILLTQASGFPRSFYLLEPMVATLLLLGVRVFSRALAESAIESISPSGRVLVVGAGFGAQMLLREVGRPDSELTAVGCVDDDKTKHGIKVLGVPVFGSVDDIPTLVVEHSISEVLIAVPSATRAQMRRFVNICGQSKVKFRTVPSLREVLNGRAVPELRGVNLDDLLGRDPVQIDLCSVRNSIQGRTVLVTGAAGSIGSEICRQLLDYSPARLLCYDQSETGLFFLEKDLVKHQGNASVDYFVADVRDHAYFEHVLQQVHVDAIFHAAAYKHVPLMEANVNEAVKNNVFTLIPLLEAAERSSVHTFVLISSDKAVNPTNIMGTTKRICELILAARPTRGLRCVSVRFGNVLGSSGSLIPVLREQLRYGDPLTITHPEIRRFFMTIPEAVSLVLQAFVVGGHSDILVLDMGEPMRVLDVAKTLIRLSGKHEEEVDIVFTGLRNGEKFFEELFYETEEIHSSGFDKIKRTKGKIMNWAHLERHLLDLQALVENNNPEDIRAKLREIVPEYNAQLAQGLEVEDYLTPVITQHGASLQHPMSHPSGVVGD